MANKHLNKDPHLSKKQPDWWWYEEAGGVEILHEVKNAGGVFIRTDRFVIPWHILRNALVRKDKP